MKKLTTTQAERKRIMQDTLAEFERNNPTLGKEKGTLYHINTIFYSIQGEGHDTGKAAVFIRFAGCNLACEWCDTEYASSVALSVGTILRAVLAFTQWHSQKPLIVLTGGEPSLQVTQEFVDAFRNAGYALTMETNGIVYHDCFKYFDTVTVSPKTLEGWWSDDEKHVELCSWIATRVVFKIVYDTSNPALKMMMAQALRTPALARYLQPLENQETGKTNAETVVRAVQRDPRWRLSLQTHKTLTLP